MIGKWQNVDDMVANAYENDDIHMVGHDNQQNPIFMVDCGGMSHFMVVMYEKLDVMVVYSHENVYTNQQFTNDTWKCLQSMKMYATWQETCEHGGKHVKQVKNMDICPNGMQYCMELVKSGEMPPIACEACIIDWLCDDPIETCMNVENTIQWYTQCVRNHDFWSICIEQAWEWLFHNDMAKHQLDLIQSICNCMKKYGLTHKLVKMDDGEWKLVIE